MAAGARRWRPSRPAAIAVDALVYFGAVKPLVEQWAVSRGHLREVTAADVMAVLKPLRGWPRRTAIAALRSLFRFAKKRGLVFTNPTTRLKAENIDPSLLPLTDVEITAIKQTAASPAQRLVVALAAIYAVRPATIRTLRLDDLDVPNRRITLAGHDQPLDELTHRALQGWLDRRRAPGRTPPTSTC